MTRVQIQMRTLANVVLKMAAAAMITKSQAYAPHLKISDRISKLYTIEINESTHPEPTMISDRFALVLAMLFALTITVGPSAYATETKTQTATKPATYTPAKGSEERKAIMNALRVVIRKMSGLEVIFVVRHLKVNNGWAWIETEPQSADGKDHYESMVGLLHKKNGRWTYVEGPPEFAICEQDPDCMDTARYFKKLARKYPAVSPDIFPKP